ncbi:MAG TPA: hypothetical protein VMU24_11535 [Candidatus Acidoferrales bacterium]|nr:hypothetical protein [Candidatus Acidoferrales bacterium]
MSTTLFQAKPYDPQRERRKKIRWITAIVLILILAAIGWHFRYWQYEHRVNLFFDALQQKNYEQAYGIWMNDPNWKQHPQQYRDYTFGSFYLDWGPGGEWGLIKTHKVIGTVPPPTKGNSTGVIVGIIVNERAEQSHIWVEKKDKTMHPSPY